MKTMTIESAVVKSEIAYILNKMAEADEKKKECVNHYSKLYKATEDKLAEFGVVNTPAKTKWGASYKFMLPKHNSKAYKSIIAFVGDDFKPNVDEAEMNYIIEKIRLAKEKGIVCHYSYLSKHTLNKLTEMGIQYDMLGKHGYRFHYPTKKSKAWYRLINFNKVHKDANGKFVSNKVA